MKYRFPLFFSHFAKRRENTYNSFLIFRKSISTNIFKMKQPAACVIETEELQTLINSGKEYLLFDASVYNFESKQSNEIQKEYENMEKIKGSIHLDFQIGKHENQNLCHLFPNEENFFSCLKNLLIRNETNIKSLDTNTPVIFYEQSELFYAPRVWFLFKLFGFQNVKILNGGLNKWINEKKEVIKSTCSSYSNGNTSEEVHEKIKRIEEMINKYTKQNTDVITNNLKCNIYHYDDIKKLIELKKNQQMNHISIIDTRPNESFTAKIKVQEKENEEKIVSNCLPFSTNIPYTHFLRSSDQNEYTSKVTETTENTLKYVTLKNISDLQGIVEKFDLLNKDKVIVSVCNKGVTASILLFVLYLLNKPFSDLIIYPGGMIEYKLMEYNM